MKLEITKLTCEITQELKGKRKATEYICNGLKLKNWSFIGSGVSRSVFVHNSGKYVLKIENKNSLGCWTKIRMKWRIINEFQRSLKNLC